MKNRVKKLWAKVTLSDFRNLLKRLKVCQSSRKELLQDIAYYKAQNDRYNEKNKRVSDA